MNSKQLILRLKEVIAHYKLSASNFADRIDVQRSSISHLLSGRNKPSLDFVMKVVDEFEEVDLYWLLYGKGSFPKSEMHTIQKNENEAKMTKNDTLSLFTQNEQEVESISNTRFSEGLKKIIKVILLYEDGTFEEYKK